MLAKTAASVQVRAAGFIQAPPTESLGPLPCWLQHVARAESRKEEEERRREKSHTGQQGSLPSFSGLRSSLPLCLTTTMSSISPAKKRKADCHPAHPATPGPGTALSANLSLADLNRLIDQRVETKTLALASRVEGLQRENEELFLRCESLERSVQILKKEGNWTYSAPDVLRSHWIDHDGDDATDTENLFQSIKESTQNLRLSSGDEIDVGFGTLILSDNVLYPHWEQLANATQLSERITKLDLWYVQLDARTLRIIETSARQKGITTFNLTGNQFLGGEGVQFASDVLKSNRSVEYFRWDENSFHSTDDAYKLIDAVLEHPTIRHLAVKASLNEDISPLQRLFAGVGTDKLLSAELSFNGIKTNGDRFISDFLSANPPLESLDLDGNELTDDDALHIALALLSNTNLLYLDLDDNELTEKGKTTMFHLALFNIGPPERSNLVTVPSIANINLNKASGANHTCQIQGIYIHGPNFTNDSDKSAKLNRRKKMFWLLAHRRLNGCIITQLESEFSEKGLGLVPHVLACINAYSADYPKDLCLSVLFELARNWKTPEMYQLH